MMRKNKKAILMPEVLKLLLALACIVILIYLFVSLYQIFTGKSDFEKAKSTLNDISGKLEGLEEGDSINYIVTGPKDWAIAPVLIDENKRVLCSCPLQLRGMEGDCYYESYDEKCKEQCKKEGVCKEVSEDIEIIGTSTLLDLETDGYGEYVTGLWGYSIQFSKLPMQIKILKIRKSAIMPLVESEKDTSIIFIGEKEKVERYVELMKDRMKKWGFEK